MRKDIFKQQLFSGQHQELKSNVICYLKETPNIKENVLDKLFTKLIFKILNQKIDYRTKFIQLLKAGLGGRICYSKDNVEKILLEDKRLNSLDELIKYISKLENLKHLSVFRHAIFVIDKELFSNVLIEDDILQILKKITLIDILHLKKGKFKDLVYHFASDLNDVYNITKNTIPFVFVKFNDNQIKEFIQRDKYNYTTYLFELFKKFLEQTFYTPYIGKETITINLQHILELYNELDKQNFLENIINVKKEKTKFENIFNLDTSNEIEKIEYEKIYGEYIKFLINKNKYEILYNKDLNQTFNLWILDNNFENEKIEDTKDLYITFIVEGLNRNFSHQLVRHTLYSSYSQRSLRYVNEIKSLDSNNNYILEKFLVPEISYIQDEIDKNEQKDEEQQPKRGRKPLTTKQKIYKLFVETYELTLDNYKELIEKYKVKKEDARDVLSCGIKTTIITTMYGRGLENFLIERTSPKAQRHIRLVAEKILELI